MIKYFCDRCKDEIRMPKDVQHLELKHPNEFEYDNDMFQKSYDLCKHCLNKIKTFIVTADKS